MTSLMIFISCVPRLEALLEDEVTRLLSKRKIRRKHGGLELRVTHQELWTLSHDLRIAASIRVRLGESHAPHFDALEQSLGRLPWSAYLERTALPKIQVSTRSSALYHSDAVRERIEDFFIARVQRSGAEPQFHLQHLIPEVSVRIVNDVATVSLDAAEELYRRGLRTQVHRAPLRETYAAACLRVSGLDRSMKLADPLCGTGVFLSERAAIDGGLRLPRTFAFEQWSTHDADAYAAWCAQRSTYAYPNGLRMWGGDRDAVAVSMAQKNLASWSAGGALRLTQVDVRQFLAGLDADTDVIANPPWGKRLGGADAVGRAFGDWLRARPADALGQVVVLVTGHEFLRASGVPWHELLRFTDANTPVRVMRYGRLRA